MRIQPICLLLALGLASCGEQDLQKQLEQLTAEEIVIPSGMRQMVEGRDSVTLNPAIGAARLVVWVDSVACSSCRASQIFQYAKVINYREETGDEFVPIFIFSPPHAKLEDLMLTLKYGMLDYPVFIDESNAFPAANPHIPADNRLHTFLLDKNGNVELVGDPAQNPGLWELYRTTIAELIAGGGTLPAPAEK